MKNLLLLLLVATLGAGYYNTNSASYGTGYIWYGMTKATNNSPSQLSPAVNDGVKTDFPLNPSFTDNPNAYEALGVLWNSRCAINAAMFYSGGYTFDHNGVFGTNLVLQYTTNGTTWMNSNWSNTPSYLYDSYLSANTEYIFTGAVLRAAGVRVCGQVRVNTTTTNSWYCNAQELQTMTWVPIPPTNATVVLNWQNTPATDHYEVWTTTNLASPFTFLTNAGTATSATWVYSVTNTEFNVPSRFYITKATVTTPATNFNLTLAWDSSTDVTVTGYRMYYGGVSGVYTNVTDVGNTTTTTLHLGPGYTYFFVVTAYDSAGLESVFSNEVSYSVPSIVFKTIDVAQAISVRYD